MERKFDMRSFKKILFLTFLITGSFLARDTVTIEGPLDMSPVITILLTSFLSSLILINSTENRKTQNHSKLRLSIVSFIIGFISLFGAYVFNISSYSRLQNPANIIDNVKLGFHSLYNYGYVTLILCIIFGVIIGSNKKLGKTQHYKSSKHKYNY